MILRGNIYSEVLEKDTGITIVTPRKELSGEKYKVAYLLHGLGGDNESWLSNTMLGIYARKYNIMYVMPNVDKSFYRDMEYGDKYFTYVTDELPKRIKKTFNVSDKREDTMVMGCSMGGYGALKCALNLPEQYGSCMAYSSGLLFLEEAVEFQRKSENQQLIKDLYGETVFNDITCIFGENLDYKDSDELSSLLKPYKNKDDVNIYMACGDTDQLKPDNDKFAALLKETGFTNIKYETLKGGHTWYVFDEALENSLRWYDEITK